MKSDSTCRYPQLALLIDGQWIPASDRDGIPVENPASLEVIGSVPVATTEDIDAALDASQRAFATWRETSPYERVAIITKAAQFLRERGAQIGCWMTLENGKPLWDGVGECSYTADIMDSMANDAPRNFGTVIPCAADFGRMIVVAEPIGPVAAFTTWNYPVTVPGRKIASALAAGCTVVIKPAEETPASAIALAQCFQDAGLPDGVLNVLFGEPAMISSRLIKSPTIRKVSFTGSTVVGKQLAALAGAEAKPVMLELGGHAPVMVFDDVDPLKVAELAVGAKIHNSGQSCGSPTRFFVHSSIYRKFVSELARLFGDVKVGDGFSDGVQMGPLANSRRFAEMKPLIDDAVTKGATIAAGGTGDDTHGYYFRPTLLVDVSSDADIMHVEPFGPIAAVMPFDEEREVIARANDVEFGLGAYLFTESADRALRIPGQLDFGMVSVNRFGIGGRDTFFGGRKASGFGSEGGPEAMDEYLTKKLITQQKFE